MNVELHRGDRLRLWTSGGGGYGDPLERPPESVLDDVLDGKVSVQAARESYGVLVENGAHGLRLNERETARLREMRRATSLPAP
jgi:N-methylhydantoinase B/oxoprolinase/acetone carboxylase alpha subunit